MKRKAVLRTHAVREQLLHHCRRKKATSQAHMLCVLWRDFRLGAVNYIVNVYRNIDQVRKFRQLVRVMKDFVHNQNWMRVTAQIWRMRVVKLTRLDIGKYVGGPGATRGETPESLTVSFVDFYLLWRIVTSTVTHLESNVQWSGPNCLQDCCCGKVPCPQVSVTLTVDGMLRQDLGSLGNSLDSNWWRIVFLDVTADCYGLEGAPLSLPLWSRSP